jgi:hypothetical protein
MRPIKPVSALCISLQLLAGTADAAGNWRWPVRGPVLTAYANGSDPYAAGQHRGIDIGARVGTPVAAAEAGTVVYAGVVGSSGLTIAERTADGRFELSYLHLSAASVRAGDEVDAGEPIGVVGTSGRRSADEPHLHFGVRDAGQRHAYRDPLDFLGPPPAGDAPDPRPVPVPVGEPARPEPAPAPAQPAATQPAFPSLPAAPPLPSATATASPLPASRHAAARVGAGIGAAFVAGPGHADEPSGSASAQAPGAAPSREPAGSPRDRPRTTAQRHGRLPDRGPQQATETSAPEPAHRPDASPHRGINVGWLAACLGLIAAATMLGHPDQTRTAATRGRAGLASLLRPLTGKS